MAQTEETVADKDESEGTVNSNLYESNSSK
jgi:hypothetical protein